ncbi:kinesin-like protein subito [Aethina tumida]|uniref:kinesin-like protein subito n=1 Tax=Aethina tumida TaxID=116153 RepID=UPI002147D4B2|nr:kinesin-like protein subito [Aethina tumida]
MDSTIKCSHVVSFLQARDPSLLAWNVHDLDRVRADLKNRLFEDTVVSEPESELEKDDCLKVFLRIKSHVKFDKLYTVDGDTLISKIPEDSHVMRNAKVGETITKKFTFSKILGPECTQSEMFNKIVKPKLLQFINGKNSTVMSYGASGSGKTYTIVGTENQPGLIPRSLEYVFRSLPQISDIKVKPNANGSLTVLDRTTLKDERRKLHHLLSSSHVMSDKDVHTKIYKRMQERLSSEMVATVNSSDVSVSVWVSFAEIYNEKVYDLLVPPPPRGKTRPQLRLASSHGHTYIKDLAVISVTSGLEAYQILQYGLNNLNYAATSVNSNSSRSHAIFTIKIAQVVGDMMQVSYFNFCDLAGAERLKKTRNVGERLKESNNINTSLMVLSKCINMIRQSQKQANDKLVVPFRESKLTQLFQKALGGHENICMIVNINPSLEMFDETHHVLNFSAVVKEIIVDEKPTNPIVMKKLNRFSAFIQGRSTSIQPMPEIEEHDEGEEPLEIETVEGLRRVMNDMYEQFMAEKAQWEASYLEEKQQIKERYNKVINEIETNYNKRLREADAECKRKVLEEREFWQNIAEQDGEPRAKRLKQDDCIVLSDEEDDGADDGKDFARYQLELMELRKQVEDQKKEIEELKLTLYDAEKEYTKLLATSTSQKKLIIEQQEALHQHEAALFNKLRDTPEEHDSSEENVSEEVDTEEKVEHLVEKQCSTSPDKKSLELESVIDDNKENLSECLNVSPRTLLKNKVQAQEKSLFESSNIDLKDAAETSPV